MSERISPEGQLWNLQNNIVRDHWLMVIGMGLCFVDPGVGTLMILGGASLTVHDSRKMEKLLQKPSS